MIDGERVDVGCEEELDCSDEIDVDVDPGRDVGLKKLDARLRMLENGGNKPPPAVVLVVVGNGVEVVVGVRGRTTGWLTELFYFREDIRRERTSNLTSKGRTGHRVRTGWREERKEGAVVRRRMRDWYPGEREEWINPAGASQTCT